MVLGGFRGLGGLRGLRGLACCVTDLQTPTRPGIPKHVRLHAFMKLILSRLCENRGLKGVPSTTGRKIDFFFETKTNDMRNRNRSTASNSTAFASVTLCFSRSRPHPAELPALLTLLHLPSQAGHLIRPASHHGHLVHNLEDPLLDLHEHALHGSQTPGFTCVIWSPIVRSCTSTLF